MLNNVLSADEILRYSRQINLKEISVSGQTRLKNARVLCVGLGGLGSSVLLYLAAAGVGILGLIDSDIVELSNLQRQVLYSESQVSCPKITAAVAQIRALNSSIKIDTYFAKFTKSNAIDVVSQYDIVADCSDNFYTNYLVHDICFSKKIPYVYASVAQFQGYCSFFNGRNACLRCLFPSPDPKLTFTCNNMGILGVVPGIFGVIQATEILKWILEIGQLLDNKLLVADLLNMTFRKIQLFKNPDCILCAHNYPM